MSVFLSQFDKFIGNSSQRQKRIEVKKKEKTCFRNVGSCLIFVNN